MGKLEEQLRATYEAELAQLPRGEVDWPNELTEMIGRYDSIAYLTRLLEQTAEKRFQLAASA